MSSYHEHPAERDSLDARLDAAQWPELDPQAIARLDAHWKAVRTEARRRWWLGWTGAAAACVAIGVGAWLFRAVRPPATPPHRPQDRPIAGPSRTGSDAARVAPGIGSHEVVKEAPVNPPDASRAAILDRGANEVRQVVSRAPTVYESLVFRAMTPPPKGQAAKRVPLQEVLDRIAAAPGADIASELAPLLVDRPKLEADIARIAQGPAGPRRDAAIRLLPAVGGRRSLPLLMQLAGQEATHAVAVEVLAPVADSSTLAGILSRESSWSLRTLLASELLQRGDVESVRIFVRLLNEPGARGAALAALDRAQQPPIDALFALLEGTQQSERLSAAVALGRLDGPVITRRLIGLAQSDGLRQEALVGLLASDGVGASQFLSVARQDATMMAAVGAAEYQLLSMTQ